MFLPFMMNAWMAGTIVAIIGGVVGIFVVLRGETFMAHAIPHGSFTGAAAAVLLGLSPMLGMAIASIIAGLVIVCLSKRGKHDEVTALMLVFLLGFGTFLLAVSGNSERSIYGLLFGDVLSVQTPDLLWMVVLAVVALAIVGTWFRPLLYGSIIPDMAASRGVSNTALSAILAIVVALVTTTSVPVVGALLMFALLVAPPAAAVQLTASPLRVVAVSVAIALVQVWAAIALAYLANFPVGFTVTALGVVAYMIAKVVAKIRGRARAVRTLK